MSNDLIQTSLTIETLQIKKAALLVRAVNHKLRQQILKLLHEDKRMTVTTIFIKLRLDQPVASQQLAILRKAGFVNTERDGKFIFYSVNYDRLKHVQRLSMELINWESLDC
jgi:DNA-binding transcriptional ArsR family regulator